MKPKAPETASIQPRSKAVETCTALAFFVLAGTLATGPVVAQSGYGVNSPVSPAQRAAAQASAEQYKAGVPVSELNADAPKSYTVKRGDTLWRIAGIFLKSPWRWPNLWGMNLDQIRNPHLIYPGQELFLHIQDGRAFLRTAAPAPGSVPPDLSTVKLSPRTRATAIAAQGIPAIDPRVIEPFLAEPLIVDALAFAAAPRFVATQETRVLLSKGDRAYARSLDGTTFARDKATKAANPGTADDPLLYRVFRNVTPLRNPGSKDVLAYEAQYVGKAELIRPETQSPDEKDAKKSVINPATVDIVHAKEEIRTGDRLWPDPALEAQSYVPRAAPQDAKGQIISIYGSGVTYAGQNQVVAINLGTQQGMAVGHVLAITTTGEILRDKTDEKRPLIQLPIERNGLLMVFRVFDKVSYGLILQVKDGAKVGDRLFSPDVTP